MATETSAQDLDWVRDPYPLCRRLQVEDPVHWDERLSMWLLTRYDDILAVMRDSRFAVVTPDEHQIPADVEDDCPTFLWLLRMSLEHMNPPAHTRLRRYVMLAFAPRMIEGMRPRVEELVDRAIDRTVGAEQINMLHDIAYPIVSSVTPSFIGVPDGELDQARSVFEHYFRFFTENLMSSPVRREAEHAALELLACFRAVLERRRTDRGNDMMSVLLSVQERTGALGDEDILALCIQLLVAGWQATPNFLANALAILLRHPDQLEELRSDPARMPAAVEELLRYDPVIRLVTRVAREDVEIRGKGIARGERIILFLAGGSRDPAEYCSPDQLDIARPHNHHLALGHGIHYCLGAALARVVAQTTFRHVLERLSPEQLADSFRHGPEHFSFPRAVWE